jgi:putative acetyltransferase
MAKIIEDDLSGLQIRQLLKEHFDEMHSISGPESTHVLSIEELRQPTIKFWSLWDNGSLMGCGALRTLDDKNGEIKSMRVASAHRRQGVASNILSHIIAEARSTGLERISLETGAMDHFLPARRLYEEFGFEYCQPFGDYLLDPNSMFMTLSLDM